jgi:tetratricopeptide (TPR) repeat protein
VLEQRRKTSGDGHPGTLVVMNNLAWVYARQKQYAKAEPLYLKALEGTRRLFGEDSPNTLVTAWNLALLYQAQHQYAKAEPLFLQALDGFRKTGEPRHVVMAGRILTDLIACYRYLGQEETAAKRGRQLHGLLEESIGKQIQETTAALEHSDSDPSLFAERGELYGRLGRFEEAAADFEQAIDLQPQQAWNWLHGIPLLLQVGDADGYRRRRARMLREFQSPTETSFTAHLVAKCSLIIPLEGDDMKLATVLADRQVAADEDAWRHQCKGMAEYRLGHNEAAIPWLLKGTAGEPWCRAESELFLAMAYSRLGREQQGRAALDHAVGILDRELPRPGEGDLHSSKFFDWILCQFARREAEALIGPATPATRPATQPVTQPARE